MCGTPARHLRRAPVPGREYAACALSSASCSCREDATKHFFFVALYAVYQILHPRFHDSTSVVMNFWQGGHWDIHAQRAAHRRARHRLPSDVQEWRDFPIIARLSALREFTGMSWPPGSPWHPDPQAKTREVP